MTKKTESIIPSVTFSMAPLFFTTWNAHFYIDPGTGSLVLQMLAASFVGGLFLTKVYWGKLKHLLGNLFSRNGKSHD